MGGNIIKHTFSNYTMELIKWDLYEISTTKSALTGVKLRGRIRKFGLEKNINILAENTQDVPGRVRIALIYGTDASAVKQFLKKIVPNSSLELKKAGLINPVLLRTTREMLIIVDY
jgi:hypothetical protein